MKRASSRFKESVGVAKRTSNEEYRNAQTRLTTYVTELKVWICGAQAV